MIKLTTMILPILFVTTMALPAWSLTPRFPDKIQDTQSMNLLMEKVDNGDLTLEQALVAALKQGISFSVIVDACNSRDIALGNIITAAATIGISSTAILAWMADAEVPQEQMIAANIQANGQPEVGLGYTPAEPEARVVVVRPITANPGGTAQGGSVSPSSL